MTVHLVARFLLSTRQARDPADGPVAFGLMAPDVVPAEVKTTAYQPTIVTESNLRDGERETVVRSPLTGRSASSRSVGAQTQSYEHRTVNEDNVPDALHRLADRLNHDARSRTWREQIGDEDPSADGTMGSSDGRVLKCQVTRVERATLSARGGDGSATSSLDNSGLAAAIIAAIESKRPSADQA